jgi:HD-GYP domain-containing protein (c-di-GMP phosphodiesterase class II)
MKEVPLDKLQPLPEVPTTVLHKSGHPLVKAGEALTEDVVKVLREDGITSVFFMEPDEKIESVRRELTHVSLPITELQPGEKLERTLYEDSGRLLLEAGTAIPRSFAASLEKRGIQTIYYRRPDEDVDAKGGRALRSLVEKAMQGDTVFGSEKMEEIENLEMKEADREDLEEEKLKEKINRFSRIEVLPDGEPFEEQVRDTREHKASAAEKQVFSSVIKESIEAMRMVQDALLRNSCSFPIEKMDKIASNALGGTIQHRDLLCLLGLSTRDEDYLVSHALAMTVLATNLGSRMNFAAAQIKALAYGAILADVGMLKIPKEVREKKEKLSPREVAEIRRHPSIGLDMLQRVPKIPAEVPYIVFQSHERSNGSGYPAGKRDVVIHPFARIVGTVDIFTSVCAERPYREAKLPYEAMESLIMMCSKKLLNRDVVRAFLQSVSLFPVGSFIKLEDERIGRVVASNPENYGRPVVALIFDEIGSLYKEPDRVNLLEREALNVTAALGEKDLPAPVEPMAGF